MYKFSKWIEILGDHWYCDARDEQPKKIQKKKMSVD